MRLALCGLEASGKTTLFTALSGRRVAAGGGRTEAGQALLTVPDPRVDWLSELFRPKKTTHAQITYVDPPPPPAKPEDPAARLPQELKQADGLVEVVRNFDGGLGAPDAKADHQAFGEECLLHDQITVERRLERMAQERQRGRKVDQEELSLMEEALALLQEEKPLRQAGARFTAGKLRGFGFLTAKPMVVVANNEDDDPAPPEMGQAEPPVVVRARIEAELAELDDAERQAFMSDLGLKESTLDRLIRASYAALEAISFFTVGEDEVRAWTVKRGSLAPQAAGVIHSDLEKGFIRAEIMRYQDLRELGSEAAVKKAGLFKLAGKDYVVEDGDILHVRFNV